MSRIFIRAALAAAATLTLIGGIAHAKDVELLNVSYDPTRELYEEYNKSFSAYWQKKTGDKVTIKQSHGGSGKQARGSTTTFAQRGLGDVLLAWENEAFLAFKECRPQLLPAEQARNPGEVRQGVSQDQDAGDHRRLWRLDAGAVTSLRGWWRVRQDLRPHDLKELA